MKRKMLTICLAMLTAGSMVFTPVAAFGEQDTEVQTEETQDLEAELEDLTLKTETQEIIIKNQSGHALTLGKLEKSEKKTKKKESEEESEKQILTILDGEEKEHVFELTDLDSWTGPIIYDEYGFLYIKYQDSQKKEQELMETAEEKEWDTALTMYLLSNVNVREKADKESESLKVLSTGTKVTATAIVPGWIKIETDELTGYIYHSYITENKEAADAKVQAEKEAREQAEAAAAAAAAAQAAAQQEADYSYTQETNDYVPQPAEPVQQPQEVYEVSRQQYDDCDGSGHGYYEIIYSDGSVAYEDY